MESFKFTKQLTIQGMDCLIISNRLGCLCGYVSIPANSTLFELHYTDDLFPNFDVHGGVTFTDKIDPNVLENLWAIGFDCSHADDGFHPDFEKSYGLHLARLNSSRTWKDEEYVTKELEKLVLQIKEHDNGII